MLRTVFITTVRVVALALVYLVCFVVISGALLTTEQPTPGEARDALISLLVVSLITTAGFAYVILRSRWTGWKLVLAIFFVFYGVTTVMSQIETAFFVTHLPPGMLPRLVLVRRNNRGGVRAARCVDSGKGKVQSFSSGESQALEFLVRRVAR